MIPHTIKKFLGTTTLFLFTGLLISLSSLGRSASIDGQILDLNGQPVVDAMVTIVPSYPGPTAITAFSGANGHFSFPDQENYRHSENIDVGVRVLGYEFLNSYTKQLSEQNIELTVIVKKTSNQLNAAPPSAWLLQTADHEQTSTFILDCIGCHQVPSPEFVAYTHAIANIDGDDRGEINQQSWTALVKYMNFISAEEFGRGPDATAPDAAHAYQVGDGERVVNYLSNYFSEPMKEISGYKWGAPLAVTPDTAIMEYEVARPNAVREALLLGEPKQLWVADVASNSLFKIDPTSGYTTSINIPADTPVGPHSLHRGADGSLWMAPFVSSVVGHLDIENETWETWSMKTTDGRATGIHDLSFGADHTLLTDKDGLIWFSDIANNSVGYLNPDNGDIDNYRTPEVPNRPGNGASLYGLVMTSTQEQIWYSQLGIGSFGSFNTVTREFETSVQLPLNSGPRRLTISDDDILYIPLYGRGQLVEYDTRSNTLIGTYDMPDTASAPYAATWDSVRKVVWIPTSNADAIYKFDPADKSFSVLPMPRTGALIRMVDVDPDTGYLITSYGNIVEQVHGPRMALIINPGDGAYQ